MSDSWKRLAAPIWVAALTLWLAPFATAQQPRSDEDAEDDAVSDDELRELMEALEQDAESETDDGPTIAAQTPSRASSQGMNPDISAILGVALAGFSVDEPRQAGAHDPSATGFNLQQLELSIRASVDPFFRFDSNLVFSLSGVELEEAYATSTALPAQLQLRAGQFLTRFGRLNPTHPHSWQFLDQPLVNGKFLGAEGSRGLGAEGSWLVPVGWYVEIIGSVNTAEQEHAHDGEALEHDGGETDGHQDLHYTTALKQFFDFDEDWSAMWGLSAQFRPAEGEQSNQSEIYGTDLYLRYRPVGSPNRAAVSWQTEAMFRNRHGASESLRDWGLYSQLVWNLNPRWELGGRYEYVSGLQGDPFDSDWIDARQRATSQVTFYPSHFSRLRLQGSADIANWLVETEAPVWAVMLGLEVLVGAHGAHNF